MVESIWILFALWIILLIIGLKNHGVISQVSPIIGFFFGFMLVNNVGLVVGTSIILLNLILLWQALARETK